MVLVSNTYQYITHVPYIPRAETRRFTALFDNNTRFDAWFDQKGAAYDYTITAEALTRAGIDPTKEFTVIELFITVSTTTSHYR